MMGTFRLERNGRNIKLSAAANRGLCVLALLSSGRASVRLLGVFCAMILLGAASLRAREFDPPDTEYANGNREDDPAVLQTLPIEPTFRAYIPISVDLSYRLPEP